MTVAPLQWGGAPWGTVQYLPLAPLDLNTWLAFSIYHRGNNRLGKSRLLT